MPYLDILPTRFRTGSTNLTPITIELADANRGKNANGKTIKSSCIRITFSEELCRKLRWKVGDRIKPRIGQGADTGSILFVRDPAGFALSAVSAKAVEKGQFARGRITIYKPEYVQALVVAVLPGDEVRFVPKEHSAGSNGVLELMNL